MYVITGVGRDSGLGFELANTLYERDEQVIGVVREQSDLQIEQIKADLSEESEAEAVGLAIASRTEKLKGLIHVAGVYAEGSIPTFNSDMTAKLMAVNAYAPAIITGRLEEKIVADGTDVVFVSSTAGMRGSPQAISYGMSKAAVGQYAESLRVHLAGQPTVARSTVVWAGAFTSKLVEQATGRPTENSLPSASEVAALIDSSVLRLPKNMEVNELTFFSRKN